MSGQGKIAWSDLTPEQQAEFGNGCGPSWLPEKVANVLFGWFFEASCRHHDFNYSRGGNEKDRKKADKDFYNAMMRDSSRVKSPLKYLAKAEAVVFYGLVRTFGWAAFDYGRYKSKEEMTRMISSDSTGHQ